MALNWSRIVLLVILVLVSTNGLPRDDLYDVVYYANVAGVTRVLGHLGEEAVPGMAPIDPDRRYSTHQRTSLMMCGMAEVDDSAASHHRIDSDCRSIAAMLHEAGADMRAVDAHGWDSLHHGAVRGLTRYCDYLVASSAGLPINSADAEGITPLMKACAHGFSDTAEMLLRHGADPRLREHKGRTAVHFAVQLAVLNASYVPFLGRIAQMLPLDTLDLHNRTPLHYALIGKGSHEAAAMLLQHGADPSAVDAFGTSTSQMTRSEETRAMLAEAVAARAEREYQKWSRKRGKRRAWQEL